MSTPSHTSHVSQHVIKHNALPPSATTTQRVSSAVKCLGVKQFHIRETLEVSEQVAEPKKCALGVAGSMDALRIGKLE